MLLQSEDSLLTHTLAPMLPQDPQLYMSRYIMEHQYIITVQSAELWDTVKFKLAHNPFKLDIISYNLQR